MEGPGAAPSQATHIQDGKQLFAANCILCHGAKGQGDGILSNVYKPANLGSDSVQQMSDSLLFTIISSGRNKMPGFDSQMDMQQIQHLVLFIRTLSETPVK